MSEEVSIYGENTITGSINDAALAEKTEANGVTLTNNGETTNPTETPETTSSETINRDDLLVVVHGLTLVIKRSTRFEVLCQSTAHYRK